MTDRIGHSHGDVPLVYRIFPFHCPALIPLNGELKDTVLYSFLLHKHKSESSYRAWVKVDRNEINYVTGITGDDQALAREHIASAGLIQVAVSPGFDHNERWEYTITRVP